MDTPRTRARPREAEARQAEARAESATRDKAIPAGCSRDAAAEKKKLSRRSGRGPPPFERSGIPARAPGGARPMRGASIAPDRPEYRSCPEKRAIETRGGGGRVRTPLSRCCCSSRKMAAASGDAMAAARGRRTSFGAPHASTRVIDESRTRPARKGPRRVRRSIGRVGRARGSARRGLGHVGRLGTTTSGRTTEG